MTKLVKPFEFEVEELPDFMFHGSYSYMYKDKWLNIQNSP